MADYPTIILVGGSIVIGILWAYTEIENRDAAEASAQAASEGAAESEFAQLGQSIEETNIPAAGELPTVSDASPAPGASAITSYNVIALTGAQAAAQGAALAAAIGGAT
jgi:hypothetical protein